jgi:hypothetical protein
MAKMPKMITTTINSISENPRLPRSVRGILKAIHPPVTKTKIIKF